MSTLKLTMVMIMGFVTLALFMGCSRSSNEKVADAKADVAAAKQDVKDAIAEARAEARKEWLKFKSDSDARIAENERIVAEYKVKMTTANGTLREKYDKQIDALEHKNRELKAKLDNYQDNGQGAWEQFKTEFGHDMDELGRALKDFTIDNKK